MATWTLTVTLGGTDITARLVQELQIDAERGAARVCGLYYRPTGPVAPRDIEGLPLTIDFTANGGGPVRRFTGRVLRAKHNSETGVVYVTGQDSLKAQANGATLATMQTWCPLGLYHEAVFGARTTGWEQLQDLASTSGGTVECGPDDVPRANPLRVTSAADVTYTKYLVGTLEEGSLDYENLVNTCDITVEWRFTRIWSRPHTLNWDWGIEWCDRVYPDTTGDQYWQNQWELPTLSEVQGFDGKAGWSFRSGGTGLSAPGDDVGFAAQFLPASGWYDCGSGPFAWEVTGDGINSLTSFRIRLERRGAQTVTRTYNLTLSCAASIARYGEHSATDQASKDVEYDSTAWTEGQGGGPLADMDANGIGDQYQDQVDEADCEAAIACILAYRRDAMRATHRRPLAWQVPLALDVELDSTVALASALVVAGPARVHRLTDQITFPSSGNDYQAKATTKIEVRLSRSQAGAQDDDTLTAPAAPDTLPTHTPHASSTDLGNHIGWWLDAPDWDDENMLGWRANRVYFAESEFCPDPDDCYPTKKYTAGWNFDLPDIEAEMTDEVTGSATAAYAVAIDHDTLTGGE